MLNDSRQIGTNKKHSKNKTSEVQKSSEVFYLLLKRDLNPRPAVAG